jgi:hypothetical protein
MRFLQASKAFHSCLSPVRIGAFSSATVLALWIVGGHPGTAHADSFTGLWRGGGYVNPAEGQREKVRGRVVYRRLSADRYGVTARCATQSVNIDQSGEVRRTGRNSYAGTFYNMEYNVRGRIRVRVSGNRQSVTLNSPQGSGRLTLFKR